MEVTTIGGRGQTEEKGISLASVLFGRAAAVLWTIRIILDIAYRTFEESWKSDWACILSLSLRFALLVTIRLVNGNQPFGEHIAGVAVGPALRLLYLVRVLLRQIVEAVLPAAVVGGGFVGVLGLDEKDKRFTLVFGSVHSIVSVPGRVGIAKAGRFLMSARPSCQIPLSGCYKPLICGVFVLSVTECELKGAAFR